MKTYYRAHHPAYGDDNLFDDWQVACNVTVDLAMQATKKRLDDIYEDLASKLSDEMIESVMETENLTDEERSRFES